MRVLDLQTRTRCYFFLGAGFRQSPRLHTSALITLSRCAGFRQTPRLPPTGGSTTMNMIFFSIEGGASANDDQQDTHSKMESDRRS